MDTNGFALPTALIYDIETATAIPDPRRVREPDIKYVKGWEDHENMRVGVIVLWNTADGKMVYFTEGQMPALQTYLDGVQVDYLVTHNGVRFDDKVLTLGEKIRLPSIPSYDMLREIWKSCNLTLDYFDWKIHGGYGLEAMSIANFGEDAVKSMDGALAPIYWQRNEPGMREQVKDYCVGDVVNTGKLWHQVLTTGQLKNPKARTSRPILHLARPWLETTL